MSSIINPIATQLSLGKCDHLERKVLSWSRYTWRRLVLDAEELLLLSLALLPRLIRPQATAITKVLGCCWLIICKSITNRPRSKTNQRTVDRDDHSGSVGKRLRTRKPRTGVARNRRGSRRVEGGKLADFPGALYGARPAQVALSWPVAGSQPDR
ncbi:hypothetical protein BO71DRAFT_399294 [Aspergillus ellipticus CBS 707.79]|uniref:Uncharacterized protein n=1 Tax=Aspergillus ellipticus CBS 707.79 TaxID=1448320 RepID=A0A319D988_9EURO|nr:hypothetical protein BO71DRAFT_399294 [Aspergillus ellipticus CBS 707.79]